jgi:hypothetical protein
MANLVVAEQKRVGEFRKQYGSLKIGDVTIDMVSRNKRHISDKAFQKNFHIEFIIFRLTVV